MNRRGFLKIAGAAPVGAVAAVVAPKVAAAGGQFVGMGAFAPPPTSPYPTETPCVPPAPTGIYAELQNFYGLLGAAQSLQYQKRQWQEAYRAYRTSPWTKPADYRERNCRVIWRKFVEDRKISPHPDRYSEESELQRMKKQWAKLPAWLRERAIEIHKKRERENWGKQVAFVEAHG